MLNFAYNHEEASPMAKRKGGSKGGAKRVSGGHIRSWRKTAFNELPTGTDQQIADRVNALAAEAGFAGYTVSPDGVAKWRSAPASARPARQAARVSRQHAVGTARVTAQEGEAIPVLRQLVRLLGKEEVKRIID